MKKHFSVLLPFLLLLIPMGGFAQKALFEKYENTNGVTTVYISQSMLRMVPNMGAAGHDFSSVSRKLDGIRILNCERQGLASTIRNQAEEMIRKEGFEVVIKVNESGEHTTIYRKQLKGGRSECVLLHHSDSGLNVIDITGTMTLDEIRDIMGSK